VAVDDESCARRKFEYEVRRVFAKSDAANLLFSNAAYERNLGGGVGLRIASLIGRERIGQAGKHGPRIREIEVDLALNRKVRLMLADEDLRNPTKSHTLDLGTATEVPQHSECDRSIVRTQLCPRRPTDWRSAVGGRLGYRSWSTS